MLASGSFAPVQAADLPTGVDHQRSDAALVSFVVSFSYVRNRLRGRPRPDRAARPGADPGLGRLISYLSSYGQQGLRAMIGPLPELAMRMSGEGSHERILDLSSICGEPLHLGQHENVVPARANSLGDHLKSATPHVKRKDAGLVGRDPDDAGIAAEKPADSGKIEVAGQLMRTAAAPQAISDIRQRRFQVGQGKVDDSARRRRMPRAITLSLVKSP